MKLAQIIDRAALIQAVEQGIRPKYLFFWSEQPLPRSAAGKWCLSQWYPAAFEMDGIRYPTAEHYLMAEKARLFGDTHTLDKILSAPHPGQAKALGRLVSGFDEQHWEQHRVEIAVRGNAAKFSQNNELKLFLLGTKTRVLVEASPQDSIWGIGLTEHDRDVQDPHSWKGLNLLGFALMRVRDDIGRTEKD